MQAEQVYKGTYQDGNWVIDRPLPSGREIKVEIHVLEDHPELVPPKRPFDPNDRNLLEIRRLLSGINGNLSDEILADREDRL
jgi:hypothetical protein